ncbi:oxygen-insensitive NADPH nitroreductase [Enterococcus sp. AZ072]|uniref:oxygen-insensitive NADPH nitroreductase n=1 Tax=unclassified Enterococcus TaxID=2608891 RepID=UPI003D2B1F62
MDLLDQLMNHTSVRKFTKEKLSSAIKKQLVLSAQSGSSSNFIQSYSIIEVTDPQKLEIIEGLSNCFGYVKDAGAFYVFIADLNKHAQILTQQDHSLAALKNEEAFTVSVVDTTIAAQTLSVYAESLGLGICYIGGIRNDLFKMAELLELPEYTFPLFGLSVGYPAEKNEVKPRLPLQDIQHVDRYQPMTEERISAYDHLMQDYYGQRSSNSADADWSRKMLAHFYEPRRPQTKEFLKKQGFLF